MRTIRSERPFSGDVPASIYQHRGEWPCRWISCREAGAAPFVAAYRLRFEVGKAAVARIHVTADERYELFLDGERIGRGSERGDEENWFFETYDLRLSAGRHCLVARVWSLGSLAPFAQMSRRPGFLLASEGDFLDRLGTGLAPWRAKRLDGYSFRPSEIAWGTGANLALDGGRFPWGFERGGGSGWGEVEIHEPGHNAGVGSSWTPTHALRPATLPAMMEEERRPGRVCAVLEAGGEDPPRIRLGEMLPAETDAWQALLQKQTPVRLPPRVSRRILIDLGNYYCAYPVLVVGGGRGASVRIHWAESLFVDPAGKAKGNRNEIEGKYFIGVGDEFLVGGGRGRRFETLWWQAGRYVEILVRTGASPLDIEDFHIRETRYPLEREAAFACDDARLNAIVPIALRGLEMCSHETYMDCPYYEQLMYVGDTRLEALVTYATTTDDRLPRKALRMFDASRLPCGLTQSRYPSRVTQVIPPFSLWWVAMVHDFAMWRDDLPFVRSLLPGVRAVIDCCLGFRNRDGLLESPEGWNFMDWAPEWAQGIPPEGRFGVSSLLNWQMVWVLGQVAELEAYAGEPELSARAERLAVEMAGRADAAFWDESRGLFADDARRRHFSEHAQCLALLGRRLPQSKRARIASSLPAAASLTRATIYFMHYLFEAYAQLERMDLLFDRLGLWKDLESLGLKTPLEMPEPSRSDCHAWAAHPVFHFLATVLGVRPGSFGFQTVSIRPRLGPLQSARGVLPHPRGPIEIDLSRKTGPLRATIRLPRGLRGHFLAGNQSFPLRPGKQTIESVPSAPP